MQQTQALTRLQRMTNYLGDPGLTTQEVSDLLAWSARVDNNGNLPWSTLNLTDAAMTAALGTITSASAPFKTSDVGLMVQVELAGVAQAPYDSTIATYVSPTQVTGAAVAGTTVTGAKLVLYRPNMQWLPTYALTWAAAEGWRWQAAKVAERYKFQADGGTFVRDQVFTHCLKMVNEYQEQANNTPQSVRALGNLVVDRMGISAIPYWYEVMGN